MKNPKFKVGQEVYCQSDWFAGAYIPEKFVIRKIEVAVINEEEVVLYYVKHRRTPIDERMLFATEEEAQLTEVDRFNQDTKNELEKLAALMQEVNLNDTQLLIGESDRIDTSHKYKKGDIVYGHMDGQVYEYKPEKFYITEADVIMEKGQEVNVYKVKGHGNRQAIEEYLYPTYQEALIADIIRFKAKFKGALGSITSRATSLGIESKVQAKLLELRPYRLLGLNEIKND